MVTQPESQNRGGDAAAAVIAAKHAAAAKTALNSASQSTKLAVNSAGRSMMAALKRHQSYNWHGSKTLWNKLPKAPWKAKSTAENETSVQADAAETQGVADEDEDSSFPLSEISTVCSASQGFWSESEHDVDEVEYGDVSPAQPMEELMLETLAEGDMDVEHWKACPGRPTDELMQETLWWACPGGLHSKVPRHEIWQLQFSVTDVGESDTIHCSIPADIAHQIELDVPRTRPLCMNEAHRDTLRRILRAYAVHDPAVGYCQGMSDIAAVFVLLGFGESTALRGLCSLTQACCPDYFGPSIKGYVRDVWVLEHLVHEVLSAETCRRLQSLDVPLDTLAANHFFALASHTWPLESVILLWDLFLSEGLPAVFASFLALLKLYLPKNADTQGREHMQRCIEGPEQVELFSKAVSKGVTEDIGTILEHTQQLIPCIPMSRVESLRCAWSA